MITELSKEARRDIRNNFRDYDGKLDRNQRKVLETYGISYGRTKNGHIRFSYNGREVIGSGTSGDWRGGLNLATKLVHLLEGTPITF